MLPIFFKYFSFYWMIILVWHKGIANLIHIKKKNSWSPSQVLLRFFFPTIVFSTHGKRKRKTYENTKTEVVNMSSYSTGQFLQFGNRDTTRNKSS